MIGFVLDFYCERAAFVYVYRKILPDGAHNSYIIIIIIIHILFFFFEREDQMRKR